ncbi:unnamed protein product [Linum trigynum]|uniref:Uncharacterized protein n=1 Tax=Linum trigynum TaxID=586398 RepID=A0AAV2CRD4_9ROSI
MTRISPRQGSTPPPPSEESGALAPTQPRRHTSATAGESGALAPTRPKPHPEHRTTTCESSVDQISKPWKRRRVPPDEWSPS